MNRRIVVRLREEAMPQIDRLARDLSEVQGMRVGAMFPGMGQLIGEVRGEMEVSRISALPEVASVRTQAVNVARANRRAN